jgi:hypothetical protein
MKIKLYCIVSHFSRVLYERNKANVSPKKPEKIKNIFCFLNRKFGKSINGTEKIRALPYRTLIRKAMFLLFNYLGNLENYRRNILDIRCCSLLHN